MSLENQIYTRKSCRKYLDDEMDMAPIHDFMSNVKPLIEGIDYHYDILTPEKLTIRAGWSAPYYLTIYSEKKEFYQENVGFVFQQLSLYLQSIGIGSCWVGMASPKIKDDEFVIVISFGKSNDMTRDVDDFKRKRLCEISDSNDKRLTPARLAPSAINSQPWYFKHCGKDFDVYQVKQNIIKRQILKKWNPIDIGIALSHMYVANPETFEFYKKDDYNNLKGYTYTGSIKI